MLTAGSRKLVVSAPRRYSAHSGAPSRTSLRLGIAATLLGSALIHLAVVEVHLREWLPAGIYFAALTVLQLLLAGAVLLGRWARLRGLIFFVSVSSVAIWGYSRTFGLPFGPLQGAPEAVGSADVAGTLLELGTVALLLPTLMFGDAPSGGTAGRRGSAGRRVATVLGLVLVGVVTVLGVRGAAAHGLSATGELRGGGLEIVVTSVTSLDDGLDTAGHGMDMVGSPGQTRLLVSALIRNVGETDQAYAPRRFAVSSAGQVLLQSSTLPTSGERTLVPGESAAANLPIVVPSGIGDVQLVYDGLAGGIELGLGPHEASGGAHD